MYLDLRISCGVGVGGKTNCYQPLFWTPAETKISMLLSASVKRFGVSRMRIFLSHIFFFLSFTLMPCLGICMGFIFYPKKFIETYKNHIG